ncbi:MAG: hypothetical protein LBD89_01040 [Tannerellaceae bacterium]|jgi:hypothetical protein|nr:hypothetical protein [Tannerellaceae bacterium]
MKTTTPTALVLLLCLLIHPRAEAQETLPKSYKNTLAFQPLYWVNNGLRIDYERQLKTPAQWLQLSAIGYYVEGNDTFWTLWDTTRDIHNAWGAGMEANYKYFPFGRIFYVSGGVSAARFVVKYDRIIPGYTSYEEEGLRYWEPLWESVDESQRFTRFGTNFYAGVQNRASHHFLIDVYAGFGRLYSLYDKEKYYPDNDLNTLSYRGVSLTLGFRIGFRL